MRTIKFRAFKISTKEFVYGLLSTYKHGYFNIEGFAVEKETIGQFTGLLDIEGNEIYEGDIIELGKEDSKYYNIPNVPYIVIYSNKFAGFFLRRLNIDKEERYYIRDISVNIVKKYKLKVIGNIYENK